MAFVNELFERLKKSTTGTDVQEALASLGSITDPNERTRAAHETVTLIEKYANELLARGQYKNAAYQYYSGSQVIQKFLADPSSEQQWLLSSADALAKASQEHVSWDDLLGGAACMAISSLLRIQTGDWNVNQHLDTFIKSHDFSMNQAATGCLYIPYDLAGAVNPENPNPSSLQRASNYTESYLLNTKPAAMFYEGIKRAIEITRQKLMNVVKFPSIRAVFEFDHDIIFGEEFKLMVKIENVGEGIASGVSALITIPQMLNVISGSNSISIDQLKPKAYTEAEFLLLYPSGEGKEEMTIEIPVNVEYQDILLNKNSLSLGTAQIPIRFEKKAEILLDQLKSLEGTISERIAPLQSLTISEIQPLATNFSTIFNNICTETKSNIEVGEFSSASIGINQLEKMQSFIDPFVDFLLKYSEHSKNMLEEFQTVKENTKTLVNSLEKIKEQLSQQK
ncbi:MAG: hypothetical protein JSV04_00690 [Candidatus Heimdallarchaeota archaeon]|nr:MAG: hypothetical protein JSV04_00690 [Candidatus Heimdallarchaeota archaeon]